MVSGALNSEVLQRTVVLLAMTRPAKWYISDAILSEYAVVLARPELKIRRSLRQQLLQLIENHTRVVRPYTCPDHFRPADNIFLECADAARADYLVTGNQRRTSFGKDWVSSTRIFFRFPAKLGSCGGSLLMRMILGLLLG